MALARLLEGLFRSRTRPAPTDEAQRRSTYPAPYPQGWYFLTEADQLGAGVVQYHQVLGERLVLFRDESGAPRVLDAHCPHQGANLAGGRVVKGCLECPFHAWRFDGDGKVRAIPYAARVPSALRARSWPTREYAGLVLFYFEPGRAQRPDPLRPAFELLPTDGLARMRYRGRYDAGTVNMHLIEFAENAVDFAHFPVVHGQMQVPWTSLRVPYVDIEHVASWEPDSGRPHMSYFYDQATLLVAGKRKPRTTTHATITFHGPGSLVAFRFKLPLGDIVMFQSHTPTAPLQQRVHFRWYADQGVPRALVWYVVGSWIGQWRGDIDIWENKVYRERPMLIAEDGPVHAMRRWFSAFYGAPPPTSQPNLDDGAG